MCGSVFILCDDDSGVAMIVGRAAGSVSAL
jgi:hypothetical protein